MSGKKAKRSWIPLFMSGKKKKRASIPFFLGLIVLLLVLTHLREVTLISSFIKEETNSHARSLITTTTTTKATKTTTSPCEDKKTILQNDDISAAVAAASSSEKVPLYVITASGRPHLLMKGLFHMLPFLDEQNNCGFDVHWIVVHNFPDERHAKAPLFRNAFPWITELYAYNEASDYGDHERNVAIDHILNQTSTDGLVYFLDDDNVLPMDLCRANSRSMLLTDHMYYADLYTCNPYGSRVALPASRFKNQWRQGTNITLDFTLFNFTDTASWLTPLWLFRQEFHGGGTQEPDGVRWKLQKQAGSDGLFYTGMVKALLQTDGTEDRLVELPPSLVKFQYNHISKCIAPIITFWKRPPLYLYRHLIRDMQNLRKSPNFSSPKNMTNLHDVAFHDHDYILHAMRAALESSNKKEATYVELGVWLGASSIFMSRHPLLTNVIGIDGFVFEHQWEEVEAFARHFKGDGNISFIKSIDSRSALPELHQQLSGKSIDILLIGGSHYSTMEGVMTDFELYAPLVSEGGFIVFDDFMNTGHAAGVREAVMQLIRNGKINANDYDVIGCMPNTVGAAPVGWEVDRYMYDWQSQVLNAFVLRKKNATAPTTTTAMVK